MTMSEENTQQPGDFELSQTYEQVIEPMIREVAEECERRGMPFAFYVVPRVQNGQTDAREFAGGHGDFIRSVTYMARNWNHIIPLLSMVNNFTQRSFAVIKEIAATEMNYNQENENVEH